MDIHSECRSSSASSSTWTMMSLSNRTHCLNLFLPQIDPVVVVNVVGDNVPRSLVGDCRSTSWCALVLCGCVLVVFSLCLLVGRCTFATVSLDIV